MDICFTSFAHEKLGRLLNEIYMPMNRVLTQRLGPKDYGPSLVKWFLLFIMLPPAFGGPDSPERVRYEKRNKATDLCACLQRGVPAGGRGRAQGAGGRMHD